MSEMGDQQYLLTQQYNTSANLNARIRLHERFSTNRENWQRWIFDQFQVPGEDSFAITEAEPLIAFVLASIPPREIDDSKVQRLRALIDQELAEHGAVHITKEAGLFVASGEASQGV